MATKQLANAGGLLLTAMAALGLALAWGGRALAPTIVPPVDATPGPCPTTGQIITTTVPSATYGTPTAASVYLPPCYDRLAGKLPVIYLLHGATSDETQWPDLNVQLEADRLIAEGAAPFVVVMPGAAYFYQPAYDDYVLADLLPGIEAQFHVRADGAGRAIGGLSQGGYWALKIAFEHPGLFAAVGGNSPVVGTGSSDPLGLAQSARGLGRVNIRLDVGEDDVLRAGTVQLAEALRARGLAVDFTISPGGHLRSYWRAHSGEYLRFYLSVLAPKLPSLCQDPRAREKCAI
jgi:enterochelin esterase-like enzyme